jgi:hypothetical protein
MKKHPSTRKSLKWTGIVMLVWLLLAGGCTGSATPQQSTAASITPTTAATISPVPSAAPTQPIPEANQVPTPAVPFDGERAYQDVVRQVALGPRIPGTEEHAAAVAMFRDELEANGWKVEIQETTYAGQPVRNVIAKRGIPGDAGPWTIIGAHFDTRMKADNDPNPANHNIPVPGANDGASGVAVLLELSRVLPADLPGQVWLAFFDSEDQGRLPGWDWILGSRAMAEALEGTPSAVIIVDMVGDADLNLYYERNSSPELTREIWETAAFLGYAQFVPEPKHSMLDDHTPFLEKGIRAIDIIDFDYPYWHTIEDTPDKVSAESLHAVGDTVLHWMIAEHVAP